MLEHVVPAADNIAKGEVIDVPGQQAMELRVQLVASPENLPKTLYNPNDMCAHLHAPAAPQPKLHPQERTCSWLLTWPVPEDTWLTCTQMLVCAVASGLEHVKQCLWARAGISGSPCASTREASSMCSLPSNRCLAAQFSGIPCLLVWLSSWDPICDLASFYHP